MQIKQIVKGLCQEHNNFRVKKKFRNNTYLLEDANGQEFPRCTNEHRLKVFYPRITWPADPHAMHGDLLGGEDVTPKNDIFFWNLWEDAWGPQGDKS